MAGTTSSAAPKRAWADKPVGASAPWAMREQGRSAPPRPSKITMLTRPRGCPADIAFGAPTAQKTPPSGELGAVATAAPNSPRWPMAASATARADGASEQGTAFARIDALGAGGAWDWAARDCCARACGRKRQASRVSAVSRRPQLIDPDRAGTQMRERSATWGHVMDQRAHRLAGVIKEGHPVTPRG